MTRSLNFSNRQGSPSTSQLFQFQAIIKTFLQKVDVEDLFYFPFPFEFEIHSGYLLDHQKWSNPHIRQFLRLPPRYILSFHVNTITNSDLQLFHLLRAVVCFFSLRACRLRLLSHFLPHKADPFCKHINTSWRRLNRSEPQIQRKTRTSTIRYNASNGEVPMDSWLRIRYAMTTDAIKSGHLCCSSSTFNLNIFSNVPFSRSTGLL